MLEIHELIGRDVDELEDVRRRFEASYTETYSNPLNGDWISDDYFRIIDLTTWPSRLSGDDKGKLNRSISRLNGKLSHIQTRLGGTSLLGAYNSIVEGVNIANSKDPDRQDILRMEPLPVEIS